MSGIGATEIAIIAGLVLAMGLFWGVLVFVVGWSSWKRRARRDGARPGPTQERPSGDGALGDGAFRDGDRADDRADDAR